MTSGEPTPLACKQAGMTPQTYYRRRKERCELKMEQAKLMKHLEKENTRLWRLVAELSLEKQVLKDVAEGNFEALEGDFGDQYHHFLAATTRSPLMPPRHRVAILEETAATRCGASSPRFSKWSRHSEPRRSGYQPILYCPFSRHLFHLALRKVRMPLALRLLCALSALL